jgi:hypothetical protein
MSNCSTGDQQSQRQINVKECFGSWVVIQTPQGGKILFANSAGRKVGLDAESLAQYPSSDRPLILARFVANERREGTQEVPAIPIGRCNAQMPGQMAESNAGADGGKGPLVDPVGHN